MKTDMRPTGRIVVAGGSGFLGLNLARYLTDLDCEVVILSRHAQETSDPWRFVQWDARRVGEWKAELDGAAGLVNLTGRTVDCIKTPNHCDEILRSRVESTKVLGEAIHQVDNPPPVWVQMSTAHIYGDPPEVVCEDDDPPGYGLAPTVGKAWEAAYAEAVLPEMRQVILRTSFVLGKSGGALKTLGRLARLGLGGKVGDGRQGMSWLHELDMNRLFVQGLADDQMQGMYIATAPNPVSNDVFMRELRKAVGMPIGLPAAKWMVRIGAPLFLRTDPELAIYGRYCAPRRLQTEGFKFRYSTLADAFADLFD